MFRGAGTAYAGAILGLLLIAPTGKPQQNEIGNSSSSKTTSVERKKSLETRQVKPLQEKPIAMDKIVLPSPPKAIQALKPIKKNQWRMKSNNLKAAQMPPMPKKNIVVQEIEPLKIKPKPGTAASVHRTIKPLRKTALKPVVKDLIAADKNKNPNNAVLAENREKRATQKLIKGEQTIGNIAEPVINAGVESDEINGRALVRLLEHGSGPNIRLAWPDRERNREHLFRMLTTCFGMKTGVMDRDGSVFSEGAAPGTPWPIDLDKYSGFLRHADGLLAPSEAKLVYRIAGRHRLAIEAFSRALEAIPVALASNAGEDQIDTLLKLRAAHRNESVDFGVSKDGSIGEINAVLIPATTMSHALQAATETACGLLRVDQVISSRGD